MKKWMSLSARSLLATVLLACLSAPDALAGVWVPVGPISGGVAAYYNSASPEAPSNQAYFRAQFNNSMTLTNGAGYGFLDPNLQGIFGDVGQFGFDLIVPAPTVTITPPTLYAYDNGDNTPAGRIVAGPVVWAINDYKGGASSGPADPNSVIINSLIRGSSGNATVSNITPILGGFTVDFSATLDSDGLFHWYTLGLPDTPMSGYVDPGSGLYLSGKFRVNGTLTYLVALDTTAGMDFYAGGTLLEAEMIPEPATMGLLGLGGLALLRRTRGLGG